MSRRPAHQHPSPEALAHLRGADARLAGVIDRVGDFEISLEPDLWWSLVDAIVAQQLSVRAATTIVGRVEALPCMAERPSPEELLALPEETLRGCGLSRAKTLYIRDLATRWLDGSLAQETIPALSDEEVIALLTRVKGIGRWTAEVVMMFSLDRPDVFPVDDLGLRAAAQREYQLVERPGREELLALAEPWRPYRTTAARYLWKSLSIPS